jgi:putative membrane protein
MSKTLSISTVAAVSFALAACGGGADSGGGDNVTTVNEVGSVDNGMNTMAGGDNMAGMGMATTAQDYATQAAASDMFEIESSQLAANQAESPQVKNFARMMIADHTKTTNELKTITASLQPPVTVAPTLRPDMQSKLDQLKDAKGKDFDRLYMTQQAAGHEEALQLHKGFAQNGQEPQLKDFAQKTSQAVQKHLAEAQQMTTKMQ